MDTELEKKLHKIMKEAIADKEAAGVSLLVRKDGEEFLYCQEGMADREEHRPMSRDTIFRLYSMTKPVTAAAAMMLMERGALDLCQKVEEFLPAFAGQKVMKNGSAENAARPILLHDLLRMTSGLSYPDESTEAGRAAGRVFDQACQYLGTSRAMTTRELADGLGSCPLLFEPGSSWAYGASADVLGAVIEEVSGKRLSQFLKDELFEPLGMEDTAFYVPKEKQRRLAKAYETVTCPDGARQMVLYQGNYLAVSNAMTEPPAYEAGGAGLVSTLEDYAKFAAMLLQNGSYEGRQLLRPETAAYFRSGQLMPGQQAAFGSWIGLDGYSYGNLMRVCVNPSQAPGLTRKGEYGWDGWLGMYFANFPKENLTILMGTQKKDAGTFALTRKLRNVILCGL